MDKTLTLNGELGLLEEQPEGEAFASVSLDKSMAWAKFVLTDDKANGNKQRVPQEEFDNLINTGLYKPIKMALGQINEGHRDSLPLGAIAHLKKVGNQIHGLAALWNDERPEDVEMIRQRYAKKEPLEISWEIKYTDSSINEDGVEDLKNISLRAATLVGMPAYAGRTPITAVASQTNSNLEEPQLEELEKLQGQVADLTKQLDDVSAKLTEKDTALQQASAELDELKQYKSAIEKEKADIEKLNGIKTKFAELHIEKEASYFDENKDKLLAMTEDALDFMMQEIVAFSAQKKESTASNKSGVKIPNVSGENDSVDIPALAQYLKTKH